MHNLALKVLVFVLAAVNVWLFWPGDLYFLNDDLLHIPLTDDGQLFQTRSVRPVHELLVALDIYLWGKHAYGYHVTALVLHAIVCFQLYFFASSTSNYLLNLEAVIAKKIGLISVVLFLCYAQHSEALAWILGRAPILCAIFLLITVTLLIGSIAFALCLFTYEQAILFPALMIMLAWFNKEKLQRKKQVYYILALLAVTAGYMVVRKLIALDIVGAYEGENFTRFNLVVLASNAFRLVTRLWLNPFFESYLLSCLVLGIAIMITLWVITRNLRKCVPAIMFFVIAVLSLLLPVLSLGISVRSFESGRFLYLPALFLMIAIAIPSVLLFETRRLRPAILFATIFLCTYWLWGKFEASKDYRLASAYAQEVQHRIDQHFQQSSGPLVIDSLKVSVERIPVFRLGFKTGAFWLHQVDTSKIQVRNYIDDAAK
jgi:hypothetical protein